MSKSLSVTSIGSICYFAGYAALNVYARSGSAISAEAQIAKSAATAVVASAERSQALFGKKATAISQLRSIANECAENDWDGNNASAIEPMAVFIAESFVRAMPDSLPVPEFAPEPDGSISLDWIQTKNRFLSLSIGTNQRLAYAWLDGSDKCHAVTNFDGERIPRRVIQDICDIMNHDNPSLGSR